MKDRLGDVPVSVIDAQYLAAYRDSRTDLVSSQTIKHEVNLIRRSLALRHPRVRLKAGSMAYPLYQVGETPKRSIGRGDCIMVNTSRLIANLSAAEMRDVVDLALETGMRRSELLKLRPEHISSPNKLVRVIDPKNGVDRNIPLTGKAFEIVCARLGDSMVFSLQPDYVTKSFLKACRAAAITGLRFHDLRHEAISRFFEEGLSVAQVASISGHSDYRMLARYVHLSPTDFEAVRR